MPSPASGKSLGKLIWWVALALIFSWATWTRFSLPLDPVADPDTWGYLSPALQKLIGHGFQHTGGRNYLYSAFLFVLLRIFGDFRAIAVIQHLLGLVGGGLLLITWQRAHRFVPFSRFGDRVQIVLGLVLVAVFLLAGEPIRAEQEIRPEGICAFLLSLNLYFSIEFLARAFVQPAKGTALVGIGAGVSAMILAAVKPSFVLLAVVPLAPIGIFFFVRQNPLRQKIVLALGLFVSALVVWLPEHFLSRDDDLSRMFLPTTLFVVHADLIRDQMEDDVRHSAHLPYPREWLQRIQGQLADELAKAGRSGPWRFPRLGFSPDYLMYGENAMAEQVARDLNYDVPRANAFYIFYYWRTWRERPFAMLKKIANQMGVFYAPLSPVYDRRKVIPLTVNYAIGSRSFDHPSYRPILNGYPPALELIRRNAALAESAPPIEQSRLIRLLVIFLAVAYLPLLALTLLITAACLWRNFRKRVGWLVGLTLFIFAYNMAACLEVAIIHTLDVPRYSTIQFCFTVLAEFLAVRVLLESGFAIYALPPAR